MAEENRTSFRHSVNFFQKLTSTVSENSRTVTRRDRALTPGSSKLVGSLLACSVTTEGEDGEGRGDESTIPTVDSPIKSTSVSEAPISTSQSDHESGHESGHSFPSTWCDTPLETLESLSERDSEVSLDSRTENTLQVYESKLEVRVAALMCIGRHHSEELDGICKAKKDVKVQVDKTKVTVAAAESGQITTLLLKGPQQDVIYLNKVLSKMFNTVLREEISVSLGKLFQADTGRAVHELIEANTETLICCTKKVRSPPPLAKQISTGGKSAPKPRCNISLKVGKLSEIVCDVMVNSTAMSLDLNNGAVSKSLVNASKASGHGSGLQDEVWRKSPSGVKRAGELVTTASHGLPCKFVCHTSFASAGQWGPTAQKFVGGYLTACLNFCNQNSLKKIAIPAIGTGALGYPVEDVVLVIHEAVSKFTAKIGSDCSITDVFFVVYPTDDTTKQTAAAIFASLAMVERCSPASTLTTSGIVHGTQTSAASPAFSIDNITKKDVMVELNEKADVKLSREGISVTKEDSVAMNPQQDIFDIPKTTCVIYGRPRAVEKAKEQIVEHFERHRRVDQVTWKEYNQLSDLTRMKLFRLAQVKAYNKGDWIALDCSSSTLTITAKKLTLQSHREHVNKMIKEVQRVLDLRKKADSMQESLTWSVSVGARKWNRFESLTNHAIESAYGNMRSTKIPSFMRSAKTHHVLSYQNTADEEVEVNLQSMTVCLKGSAGNQREIRRRPETVPYTWKQSTNYMKVTVQPGCPEYIAVEASIAKTAGSVNVFILEILRIENPPQWRQYCAQIDKVESNMVADSLPMERTLYHGSGETTINTICESHFNRSFSGAANDRVYGDGSYFARNFRYSANDVFSRPNTSGEKFVLQVRVITGDIIQGVRGKRILQPKSNGKPYDSAVDNVVKPSIFVTFNDNQAYPEYVIKFKVH